MYNIRTSRFSIVVTAYWYALHIPGGLFTMYGWTPCVCMLHKWHSLHTAVLDMPYTLTILVQFSKYASGQYPYCIWLLAPTITSFRHSYYHNNCWLETIVIFLLQINNALKKAYLWVPYILPCSTDIPHTPPRTHTPHPTSHSFPFRPPTRGTMVTQRMLLPSSSHMTTATSFRQEAMIPGECMSINCTIIVC